MKKTILLLAFFLTVAGLQAQAWDPVTLMLAFQNKYAKDTRFSGVVQWQRQNGEKFAGRFVVEGEKYQITWPDGEFRCDGTYEWEFIHRSKRIKKHFYDPLLAPAVVYAFRFVRLDLEAEVVKIGGTVDKIALDIEFGSSVAQGSHTFVIDKTSLEPKAVMLQVDQEGFYEHAQLSEVRAGEFAAQGEYTVDADAWKKKGYNLTDMAKGETDAVWPEERALK